MPITQERMMAVLSVADFLLRKHSTMQSAINAARGQEPAEGLAYIIAIFEADPVPVAMATLMGREKGHFARVWRHNRRRAASLAEHRAQQAEQVWELPTFAELQGEEPPGQWPAAPEEPQATANPTIEALIARDNAARAQEARGPIHVPLRALEVPLPLDDDPRGVVTPKALREFFSDPGAEGPEAENHD